MIQSAVLVTFYSRKSSFSQIWLGYGSAPNHPDWVPVVESGSADAKLAKSQYGQTVSVNYGIRKYLKAIHQSLRVKST